MKTRYLWNAHERPVWGAGGYLRVYGVTLMPGRRVSLGSQPLVISRTEAACRPPWMQGRQGLALGWMRMMRRSRFKKMRSRGYFMPQVWTALHFSMSKAQPSGGGGWPRRPRMRCGRERARATERVSTSVSPSKHRRVKGNCINRARRVGEKAR